MKVAYIMSRWPKVSETFILNEILEMQRRSVEVSIYPLVRERQQVTQPEAVALTEAGIFLPFLSPTLLRSMFYFLCRSPRRLIRSVWDVLRWTVGSLNFFLGAVGIIPKAIHMARLMDARGIDHVHCHFANHPAVAGLLIQRLVGIPYSFTAHAHDLHVDQRMLSQKVAEAAFVVTISEHNRAIIKKGSAVEHHSKIHVVHCGVDMKRFASIRPPDGSDPMRVLCVGTLEERKGQRHLIDACAVARDAGVRLICRLVGDGPDRQSLQDQISRWGLEDRVLLVGALRSDDVAMEMNAADVVVTPSVPTLGGKSEGIPVVLMEGMAMERPVVASRLSGIPELVEHRVSGLVVEPADIAGLAEALLELAADPELRIRLGQSGRRRVAEQFELGATTQQLIDLISGVLHRRPTSSS